ncbi:MAG: 5-methyltetrahydropteroyltriglutamate--homocysteine methyltransferase [Gaiellales bacterium]|jgi:5-methyltetrahydropteroyltriglutamate--homocysteine methyltransferase|nr:5-methyltetrahydropteroyltriglutamate--homocysteine methyltransferase [Gaiellales bacterium]
MFTTTADSFLPTTVTGSWPRPTWFTGSLHRRPASEMLLDSRFREEYTDALSVVISDQERAGLDILTNGDYHLDADLAGQSWMAYPVERMHGMARDQIVAADAPSPYPPGTLLSEAYAGLRLPTVVGEIKPGGPLEFDKLWRIAQARTDRPVKFGTVSTQFTASMLELRTDRYAQNKRDLMWDMATVMNQELRKLADAGCKAIQIEEPLMHFVASTPHDERYLDFLIDCFNHEISGLEDVEVWIHTCWGNANMQRSVPVTSYAPAIEIFLDRVKGDVWTVEMKDRDFADLELFRPYRGRMPKKLALGVVSHRSLQVESPEEVAADIRYALKHLDPEEIVLSSDCGFGRGGSNRLVVFYKATAIAQGANIVRAELGAKVARVRAADPAIQPDVARSGSQ